MLRFAAQSRQPILGQARDWIWPCGVADGRPVIYVARSSRLTVRRFAGVCGYRDSGDLGDVRWLEAHLQGKSGGSRDRGVGVDVFDAAFRGASERPDDGREIAAMGRRTARIRVEVAPALLAVAIRV